LLEPDLETPQPVTVGTALSRSFSVAPPTHDVVMLESRDLTCRALMYGCCKVNSDKSTFTRRKSTIQLLNQDMYITDSTLLFRMLRNGYCNSALWILDNYEDTADPNLGRDMFGNTPLHYAIRFHGVLVTRELIRHGADMLAPCTPRRDLPVDMPPPSDITAMVGNAPRTPLDIYDDIIERWRNRHDWDHGSVYIFYTTVNDMSDSFVYPITPMWLWRERPVQDLPPLSAQEISVRFLPDMPSRVGGWRLPRCWDFLDSDQVVREKALALWHHQCRYRGKAFHGWHALPQEVIRIIISHILLFPHHPKALDARLSRLTDAYHRGQAARR
jgi:hypothetical protein